MNLNRHLLLLFFESGRNNAVVNLLLFATILFVMPQKPGNAIISALLIVNSLWLFAYLFLDLHQNSGLLTLSRRGKELLLQLTAFYTLLLIFWTPFANQKLFIVSITIMQLCLLSVYIFRSFFKNIVLNVLYKGYREMPGNVIINRLKDYLDYDVNNELYQTTLYFAANNNVQSALKQPKININRINNLLVTQQLHSPGITLDNAEYSFDKINFGDTIADWIAPAQKRYDYYPVNRLTNKILKRTFDISVSFFVIVFILSWMTPLIGLLIKLESKGPVFFKQARSGLNNKPFWCYKFRSMCVNEKSDEMQAIKGDARITRIGAFLRKTSLDEFPQFFNVLKGEMSIVGPRPHMLIHTEFYGDKIEGYMKRLTMKQGLTGWAQVKGHRGETPDIKFMKTRVHHDLWYLNNWSFWLDVKIVIVTFANIFRQEKNAF